MSRFAARTKPLRRRRPRQRASHPRWPPWASQPQQREQDASPQLRCSCRRSLEAVMAARSACRRRPGASARAAKAAACPQAGRGDPAAAKRRAQKPVRAGSVRQKWLLRLERGAGEGGVGRAEAAGGEQEKRGGQKSCSRSGVGGRRCGVTGAGGVADARRCTVAHVGPDERGVRLRVSYASTSGVGDATALSPLPTRESVLWRDASLQTCSATRRPSGKSRTLP